jgi:DNA repair protein RadC
MKLDLVQLKIVKESVLEYNTALSSPEAAFEMLRGLIGDSDRESGVVICLDSKNRPTSFQIVSTGSINSSIMHPREVFKCAVLSNSTSIIIGHNHPSGDLTPSPDDIEITKKLLEAGRILGIRLQDHLILSPSDYRSLRESNIRGLSWTA